MNILEKVKENFLLKKYSTINIGGRAKYFSIVKNIQDLKEVLKFVNLKNLKVLILGKGSNVLLDDRGFDGLVILNRIDFIKFLENDLLEVGSGTFVSKLLKILIEKNLSGLEFAHSLPATIGGLIYMNASAFDQKISDVIENVSFMNDKGVLKNFNIDELDFSYRYSSFHKFKGIIVSATLKLKKTKNMNIKILRNFDIRKKTQPLNEKTIGCIFKNTKDCSAAYLIEKSGLKNFQIGGAKISEKHANFIVNCKNAKTNDVIKLISYVKERVKDKFNILLEEEIRYFSND